MRRAAAFLLVLVAFVATGPQPAYAHGRLVVSVPAQGATLREAADSVSLAFTEKPPTFAYFTVTAPNGARVDAAWSHAAPFRLSEPVQEFQLVNGKWQPREFNAGFPARVPVTHWPEHGQYVVRYHSVASDGEEVRGELRFTYRGPISPAPPGWQAPVDKPSPELLAAVSKIRDDTQPSTAAVVPAQHSDGRGPWPWLVPVLLLVAIGGLIALWKTRPAVEPTKPARRSG